MFQDDDYLQSIFSQQQEQQVQMKTNNNTSNYSNTNNVSSTKNYLNHNNTTSTSSKFINNPTNNFNSKKPFPSSQPFQKQLPKSFLPQQFHKAKRMLNKFIFQYFNQLKLQFTRLTQLIQQKQQQNNIIQNKFNPSVKIYLNKDSFKEIQSGIRKYVGVKYKKDQGIINKNFIQQLPEMNKKVMNQMRNGAFCYMHQIEKIIAINKKAQITQIKLKYQQKNIKLPQIATPVPFKSSFYLLDAGIFDKQHRIFLPDQHCYKISQNGTITKLSSKSLTQNHINRIKCGITRDQQNIYIIGGVVGKNKLLTRKCEVYMPLKDKFIKLPEMNKFHRSPSCCVVNKKLWVFSQQHIQYLSLEQKFDKVQKQQQHHSQPWTHIHPPFSMKIYDFQFVIPITSTQIILFGGMNPNHSVLQIQKYNIQLNFSQSYHQILPQAINKIRVWGPVLLDNGISVLSNMDASVEPEVAFRKNTLSMTYITTNGVFLQNVVVVK